MSSVPLETIFLQQAVQRRLLSLERGRQVVDMGRRLAAAGRPVDVPALATEGLPADQAEALRGLFVELAEAQRGPSVPKTQRLERPPDFGPPGIPAAIERTAEMPQPPQFDVQAAVELPQDGRPAQAPKKVDNYEILARLGSGVSGTVYHARHVFVGNEVALKLMHQGSVPHLVERFFREAKAATLLRHPALVSVLDLGLHEGVPYLVMELVDGESLAAIIAREGPFDARRAAIHATQIAQGLIHAHETQLLHRDIKPENILVVGEQARLSDFGLVRQVRTTERLTCLGDLLGSPAYMSPEQARGEVDLDARVDVYGLGATLYEMLTARAPFSGQTLSAVLLAVIENPPVPPSQIVPGTDPALEQICLRCLAKAPADRYPTARDLANALAGYLTS